MNPIMKQWLHYASFYWKTAIEIILLRVNCMNMLRINKSSAQESIVILCGILYLVSDGSIRESAMILGQPKSTFQHYARMTVSELVRKASEVHSVIKCGTAGIDFY